MDGASETYLCGKHCADCVRSTDRMFVHVLCDLEAFPVSHTHTHARIYFESLGLNPMAE